MIILICRYTRVAYCVDALTSENLSQGLYRNVLLHFDADIDAFRLIRAEAFPVSDDLVKDVELLMTEAQPIQVFFHVSGKFGIACGNIPSINYKRSTHIDRPQYRFDFPIQAYGLQSGLYTYTINGVHTGTFELKTDNVLSTDTLRGFNRN